MFVLHWKQSTSEVVVVEEVDEAVERIEEGLAMARAAIRKAGEENLHRDRDRTNNSDVGFVSSGSVYLNAFTFHQLRPFLSPHFFLFLLTLFSLYISFFFMLLCKYTNWYIV